MSKILENLQEELNQYHDGAIVDNKSRMVIHDGSYIYLYLKESGVLEKASYSQSYITFWHGLAVALIVTIIGRTECKLN